VSEAREARRALALVSGDKIDIDLPAWWADRV
jgi:hypothetical protein